jgi:uncharacterized protein YbjT (DUF2867 family)
MQKEINAILYGATGMIGSGVLIECLEDPDVKSVLIIGRSSAGVKHPKVKELLIQDFTDYSSVEDQLTGYNACFFCLGISSFRMPEDKYTKITYDFSVAAAEVLSRLNPEMTFSFISGQGTDGTEQSSTMWARVKGKAENAVKSHPFKAVYLFRPGYIHPMKGVKSRTKVYQILIPIFSPLYPLMKRLMPGSVTTSENLGKAMINSAKIGYEHQVLENQNINELASR